VAGRASERGCAGDRLSGHRCLVDIGEVVGRRILLDRRILPRMPTTILVTIIGIGPFRGLHLGFSGEEWARLLYEPALE